MTARRSWSNDDWATPWLVVRDLEREFGPFDLDPCCYPETAKAPRYFTRGEDGLAQQWTGRVFCNPPYTNKAAWLRKAFESVQSRGGADLVVALVPARTDAAWFHDWILGKAEVRFMRRRVVFEAPDGSGERKRPYDGTVLAIYRAEDRGDANAKTVHS